jgi:hypothetical protein
MVGPTLSKVVRAAVYCRVEHDGRDGDSSEKLINGEAYDLKIRASTSRIARDGGIIEPHAWAQDLDAYRRNPVIMFAHWYGDPPVGTAVHTELDESDGSLVQYVKWLDGLSEDQWDQLAFRLRRLYEVGGMRTWSVGFNIKEYRDPTPEEKALAAQLGEEIYWIATRAELLETSAVPVPADKYADTLEKSFETAKRKGLIDVAPIIRHWQDVKRMTTEGVKCSVCEEDVTADDVRRYNGDLVCVDCKQEAMKEPDAVRTQDGDTTVDSTTSDNTAGEPASNVTGEPATNVTGDQPATTDADGTGDTPAGETPPDKAGDTGEQPPPVSATPTPADDAVKADETPPQDTSTATTDSTVADPALAVTTGGESSDGDKDKDKVKEPEGDKGDAAPDAEPPTEPAAVASDGEGGDEEYYEFEVEVPEGEDIDPEKAVIDQLVGQFVESLTEAVGQKTGTKLE